MYYSARTHQGVCPRIVSAFMTFLHPSCPCAARDGAEHNIPSQKLAEIQLKSPRGHKAQSADTTKLHVSAPRPSPSACARAPLSARHSARGGNNPLAS